MLLYANDLHYLIGEITDISENPKSGFKNRKKYTSNSLSGNSDISTWSNNYIVYWNVTNFL